MQIVSSKTVLHNHTIEETTRQLNLTFLSQDGRWSTKHQGLILFCLYQESFVLGVEEAVATDK